MADTPYFIAAPLTTISSVVVPASYKYIQTLGHTLTTDGADWYAIEINNSGTLQPWQVQTNSGARRWQLQVDGVSPRHFGAKGIASLTPPPPSLIDDRIQIGYAYDYAAAFNVPIVIDGFFYGVGFLEIVHPGIKIIGRDPSIDGIRLRTTARRRPTIHVNADRFTIENVQVMADDLGGSVPGDGYGLRGTCITVSDYFVETTPPEAPKIVKQFAATNCRFTREPSSRSGAAIAFGGGTDGATLENCSIEGGSKTHSSAVIAHFGAAMELPNAPAYGALIAPETTYHPHNITIRNCTISDAAIALNLASAYNVNVDGLRIERVGQILSMSSGDEGDTFANVGDKGRLLSNIKIHNVEANALLNATDTENYLIKIDTFGSSKYRTDPQNGYAAISATPARNVHLKNWTIRSSAPTRYPFVLRDARGSFLVEDITFDVPLTGSILVDRSAGKIDFERINSPRGFLVRSSRGVRMNGTLVGVEPHLTNVYGIDVTGYKFSGLKPTPENPNPDPARLASPLTVGDEEIVLNGPIGDHVGPGDQIEFVSGATTYYATITKRYLPAATKISIEPARALTDHDNTATVVVASETIVTFDHRSRAIEINNATVENYWRAVSADNVIGLQIVGGYIRNYGVSAASGARVSVAGVVFENGGGRRFLGGGAVMPPAPTRDILISTGSVCVVNNCDFGVNTTLVSQNIVAAAGCDGAFISDCTFHSANSSKILFVSDARGHVVRCVDRFGASVQAEYLPTLAAPKILIGASEASVVGTPVSRYVRDDDFVTLSFEATIVKGAATGPVTVSSLAISPLAQSTIGSVSFSAGSGVGLTSPYCVISGLSLALVQHGATGQTALTHANLAATATIFTQITYKPAD